MELGISWTVMTFARVVAVNTGDSRNRLFFFRYLARKRRKQGKYKEAG